MNFWQLKVFCTVVHAKSLSGAARLLYVTQPAISAQVLALEKHLGTQLLRRHRHGVSLTRSGQIVYDYASRMLNTLEDMERAVSTEALRDPLARSGSS
jgi:DNA-binding transcriptional LysR family regulator